MPASATPAMPTAPRVVGPAALKGLAHPLRVRLLTELSDRGRATATQLAQALGETSGATSYHLRQLHRHGFIVEDPDSGSGRERYWRTVPGGWNLPVLDFVGDPATSPAVELVMREELQQDAERVLRVMREAPFWPKPWRDCLRRMETRLELTPGQVHALVDELDAVFDRYRALVPQPGARRVLFQVNTAPTGHPGMAHEQPEGSR